MTIEQAVVAVMNLDGWNLKMESGSEATGITGKGKTCRMIFRINKEQEEIILSRNDYAKLMSSSEEIKLYFYATPKANYIYWLNDIILGEPVQIVSDTTLFGKVKLGYYLEESQASITNKYEMD
jgi:hypothetical protein